MNTKVFCWLAGLTVVAPVFAQPSFEAAAPKRTIVEDAGQRRAAYLQRVDEVKAWRAGEPGKGDLAAMDMAAIAAKLVRNEDVDACSRRVIELMKDPGTGPFWMFPAVCVAFTGRDHLSPEARAALRDVWKTTRQLRGDTENHWVMYYSCLYLMADLYPDEPAETWYTGKSSTENLTEAREFLLDWM